MPTQDLRAHRVAFGSGAVDLQQDVAGVQAGVGGRTVAVDVRACNLAAAIHPDHAIVGQAEIVLLLEVDDGGTSRSDRQDRQNRGRELELEFLKHTHRRRDLRAHDATESPYSTFGASRIRSL